MKKNGMYIAFVGIFLVLCLILSVGILVAGPALPGANEQLQKTPALNDQEGKFNDGFLSDVAAWINDHFFLRQSFISANHSLNGKVFGVSGEDSVIVGKDGWLYFDATLDNYTGINGFSDRELYAMAQNLAMMEEYCRENGKDFAFVIAPNKNSLYPEYMPNYGMIAEMPDSQKLLEQLKAMGVTTVDLFEMFGNAAEVLYYATDSHWNSKGAALGADAINDAFGVQTSFYDDSFEIAVTPYTGDLFNMLYPAFEGQEADPVYAGVLNFTYTSSATKPDSINLTTESDADGAILVYRDSFGNLLHPYLAASYGSARFSRSNSYDLTGDYDHILVELVERNLVYLLRNVPVMESLREELELPEPSGAVLMEQTASKAPEGFVLWKGAASNADGDSPVYVRTEGGTYRAFLTENNGFAVYLPAGTAPEGAAWYTGGVLKTYTSQ